MTKHNGNYTGTTRRKFLAKTVMTATAGLATSTMLGSSGCSNTIKHPSDLAVPGFIGQGDVVVLQGDSITDAGRNRQNEDRANDRGALGSGYAFLIAARLLAAQRDPELKVYNRGLSGNKVFQLADRWDKDCLALKPNVVSILIGVNDIWHKLNGRYDGTIEIYERDYRALLERTRRELARVKLVVCEPFVLRCGAVNDTWFPDFDGYRAAARRVASAFDAVFVPFQSMFDKATNDTPPAYWAGDGVHPTIAGAELMAQTWLDIVSPA